MTVELEEIKRAVYEAVFDRLSSKWGTGSDLSFLSAISCRQQPAGHPIWTPRRFSFFFVLPLLPLPELSLAFLALKEFLYLREQNSRQGLHLCLEIVYRGNESLCWLSSNI